MFVHMYLYIYFILLLFLMFDLSLMRRNLNLAKPQGNFLPDPKCTVFLCAPSCAMLNQVMPLSFKFGSFSHSTNLLLFCISVSSLACHQPMRFSFQDFTTFLRFYEILDIFHFILLSSRLKNHICILSNPNICFNNNNNNNVQIKSLSLVLIREKRDQANSKHGHFSQSVKG